MVSFSKQTLKKSIRLVGNSNLTQTTSLILLYFISFYFTVQEAARARKASFTSSNPLSLGGGGLTPRGGNTKTPLSWITGKLTGSG